MSELVSHTLLKVWQQMYEHTVYRIQTSAGYKSQCEGDAYTHLKS